jgi:hypothetical protein
MHIPTSSVQDRPHLIVSSSMSDGLMFFGRNWISWSEGSNSTTVSQLGSQPQNPTTVIVGVVVNASLDQRLHDY